MPFPDNDHESGAGWMMASKDPCEIMKLNSKRMVTIPTTRLRGALEGAFLAFSALLAMAADPPMDVVPFGLPLPEGNGVIWEDPREIHQVIVHFRGTVPRPEKVRLEYWGSRWPGQHLPKDRQPGGADVGWMELGNWHKGDWRVADAEARAEGSTLRFTFHPVNAKEFPAFKDYAVPFRYTLKIRIASEEPLPGIDRFEAFTDSVWNRDSARLEWEQAPGGPIKAEAFNGAILGVDKLSTRSSRVRLQIAGNPDPNTFDRTLVTVKNGKHTFTFVVDDLKQGALFLPQIGVAVLPESDRRDYAGVAADQKLRATKTLYDRVAEMPEQTWRGAWAGLPRKKSDIYLPLGLDGGRQRFRLDPDGTVHLRSNDHFLQRRPGQDTPRLGLEPPEVRFRFLSPARPAVRTIQEQSLPICETTWETNGLRITQTAFVTQLEGSKPDGPVPAADTTAVFMARFVFTNHSQTTQTVAFAPRYEVGETRPSLRPDDHGFLWLGENLRGEVSAVGVPDGMISSNWTLGPGESKAVVVKIPYLVLTQSSEHDALKLLDFERERAASAGYWHRRLDESARLITPELMIDEFYRAHAGHLLINCEREPNSSRRFARVGSFHYGAYGNESCMMVVDLDRRGYHQEAQECLDAWLHYQGTVGLPGDFATKDGVLYGAGGYEAGGYNQHHGWILWNLAEHYRFTRDDAWLRRGCVWRRDV